MIFLTGFSGISALALWTLAAGDGVMIAFALLFGFSFNPALSMFSVLVASISPIEELGARLGINQTASGFAAFIGLPIGGAIVAASNGSFIWAAAFTGICCLISSACICIIRVRLAAEGKL